ncbi:hypothetical protein Cgig2_003617 [Carnegiea gigantea]|uniref:Uncharacterized protein n=1 Tax=Carnegiea gigantea TaxID=171969 RepID=A0A9Q1JGW8_9CARY|nr:hypothetical protein Cgig2_003617 [Carnegiea gigantea]
MKSSGSSSSKLSKANWTTIVYPELLLLLLLLQTSSAHSWTCMNLYVFATPYGVTWDYYFAANDHTLKIESWEDAVELEYLGVSANIAFLEKHMGATFEKHPQPWAATINPEDVHCGDFLVVSKIRSRWGGFETLEKWVAEDGILKDSKQEDSAWLAELHAPNI